MGNSVAKAKDAAEGEKETIDSLLQTMANKLEAFELEILSSRGSIASGDDAEVKGGRSVARISEIRVSDGTDVDKNIRAGVENFFDAATTGVEGKDDEAKHAAIEGAKNLVTAGLSALFGVSQGQGMTKKSFVVLFLNNAFIRVDYIAYSYSLSASIWGAEANQSALCYIADLAVLETDKLKPSEIDYLLSQALSVQAAEFDKLNQLKLVLIQSAILSRALEKEDLTFEELTNIAQKLAESQEKIASVFGTFEAYVPLRVREARIAAEQSSTKEEDELSMVMSDRPATVPAPSTNTTSLNTKMRARKERK